MVEQAHRERLSQGQLSPLILSLSKDRRVDALLVGALMLAALLLYLVRLSAPNGFSFDEVYHAWTAGRFLRGDTGAWLWTTPLPAGSPEGVSYEWTHPPLAKMFMEAGIRLLGDRPAGWRVFSALFGAAGIGLVFVLGREFFDRRAGLLASILLLFDGLWFVLSRTGMNDIYVTVFLLLAYLGLYCYLRRPGPDRHRYIWLCGAALGLAAATKWSSSYSFAIIAGLIAVRELRLAPRGRICLAAVTWIGAFVLLPLAIYLLSYAQFFHSGFSFSTLLELQRQMFHYHSTLRATHDWASRWWTWPLLLKPVWFYGRTGGSRLSNVFALGNPLVFWAFLPAAGFALWRIATWARRPNDGRFDLRLLNMQPQSLGLAIALLGFFGQWLPWALSPRITFLYHMLPSVPFGCLLIAWTLERLPWRRLKAVYLGAVCLLFVFFYPIYSALPIPPAFTAAHYWMPGWVP